MPPAEFLYCRKQRIGQGRISHKSIYCVTNAQKTCGFPPYTFGMQVYVELALAENFCMDFTLLACAKFITKNRCSYARIAVTSALGACFAVVYPLFGLSGAWAVAVKVLSGIAIAAAGGRHGSFFGFLKYAAAFLALSFLLGGALIAIFSLAGVEYSQGGGYILSSVPVGIPLFFALALVLVCKRLARSFAARHTRASVRCVIYCGGKKVEQQGFFDSGNRVYFHGAPVSVISSAAAGYIVDSDSIKDSVSVHTVAGSKKMKIFTADKIEIYNGEKLHTINCVKIGISPNGISRAVLHPDLMA